MTGRIFFKLIVAVLCILIVALTAVNLLASNVAERTYLQILTRDLEQKARMLSFFESSLTANNQDAVHRLAQSADVRVTRIDRSGSVVADSEVQAGHMENHAHRPEFVKALSGQVGSDTRLSATVGVKFLYVALPLPDGALRVAVPLRNIDSQVRDITRQLLACVVLAFLPAILLAAFFSRYVSRKLAAIIEYVGKLSKGEFRSTPLPVKGRDELDLLSGQLNVTGAQLAKMVDELEQEHQKLEHLERVRKDFVINVSHELRTPVACIQGYAETLLDGALHDHEHNVRFVEIIRQNSERLGRLIADLMTLSQIELKRTRFDYATSDLGVIITDCVETMIPLAEKKRLAIIIEPTCSHMSAYCDSEAVHQVLTNLLENAVKYTAESGTITIGCRNDKPNFATVFVRDTGIGIPAADLPRLFERFYRVDKARSRELGGTGLGLAIVKHLVQSQGGDVSVESAANQGSIFSFTLPIDPIGEDAETPHVGALA